MTRVLRLALLLACWAATSLAPPRSSALGARLEAEQAANPGSFIANRSLGIWYYNAARFAEARVPLEHARRLDPNDGASALYAGLAAEKTRDFAAATLAYDDYLRLGRSARVKRDIRGRLLVVAHEEALLAAREAMARETQLATEPAAVNTVAVLPFAIVGGNSSLLPLARGLADLMITDLGRTGRLTLVERDRVQAIADEIALTATNRVEASTSVRAGRLIRAERVIQGSLVATGADGIALSSAVYRSASAQVVGASETRSGTLAQLFTLEKDAVLELFRVLGVVLTPAERQEVDRRPTQSIGAFLAYSRGLVAQDSGRLDEAARHFESARALDPGFAAAAQRAQAAASAGANIEASIRGSGEGAIVTAAGDRASVAGTERTGLTLANVIGDVNPTTTNSVAAGEASAGRPPLQRDAAAEKAGIDRPAPRTGEVTIVVRRP